MSALLRGRAAKAVVLAALLWLAAIAAAHGRVAWDGPLVSRSAGTPAQGHLENGHPLAPSGYGYVTYSYLGSALGRLDIRRHAHSSHSVVRPKSGDAPD